MTRSIIYNFYSLEDITDQLNRQSSCEYLLHSLCPTFPIEVGVVCAARFPFDSKYGYRGDVSIDFSCCSGGIVRLLWRRELMREGEEEELLSICVSLGIMATVNGSMRNVSNPLTTIFFR